MLKTTANMRLGDLSVGFVYSIAAAIAQHGQSTTELFERFELSPARLAEPHARLSIPRYMRLGHAAISLTGNPALGLTIGQYSLLSHLGLAGITAAQAPTVRAAARCISRFEPLYAQNYRGASQLLEDNQGAWLSFYSIAPYNAYNCFVVESVLRAWISHLSQVCQQDLAIELLQIEFSEPSYAAAFSKQLKCPLEFNAKHNRIRLSQKSLALHNPAHCPSTWHALLQLCEEQLALKTRNYSLVEQVSQLIAPVLKNGEPSIEQIAQKLHIPSWTLRRKLAAQGTQFRQLVNQTRFDLASSYIRDTELTFGEISWLLGFSSPEAFQRAFKRWAQHTPGEFRRALWPQ
ncbi:MAG: AraC family transcriptional regulator [Pseudomonas sp.]|nr:AraC family transcriptional regulator [Pseudomonas sp.]